MRYPDSKAVLAVIIAGAVVAAVVSWSRALQAGSTADRALARYESVCDRARELYQLRAEKADAAGRAESKSPKLATAAADVLGVAGLPTSALASLSPESESIERAGANVPIARRRATLTLTPLTLPQLGRVLDVWRQRLPMWTVARIDLEPRRDGNAAPGADLPLRAVLVVEAVSIAPDRRTP